MDLERIKSVMLIELGVSFSCMHAMVPGVRAGNLGRIAGCS